MITEGWVEHDSASLHYLMKVGEPNLTPLMYIPGSLGPAEYFRSEMDRLAPRTTVAIDARGIGASSAPKHGYAFEDRVSDLAAVLGELQLFPVCLMAFSAGVPVALSYAITQPQLVSGLILLDYRAVSVAHTEEWAAQAMPFAERHGIPEHVVNAMVRDAKTVELWEGVATITSPVLLITGGQSNYVTEEALSRYREALPQLQLEVFEDSGHEVYRPDYERFMRTIEQFLRSIDRNDA